MANLHTNFAGIQSPNPFWLASAPPTDKAYNVNRAFEAGWGGVVWKTLGEAGPPIVNVNGPRYGALLTPDRRLLGFNNIELITDRELELNLKEIREVKRNWPDRAMVVSLMVPCQEESWKAILPPCRHRRRRHRAQLRLPTRHERTRHGRRRGPGAGVHRDGHRLVQAYSKLPVIVKLTPNITDVRMPARAAKAGGADAVSLINTINSIMGVDPTTLKMSPNTGGMGSHGGYCGPAVKPIALNMVAEIARDPQTAGLPISGIGGIGNWRDALDFIALGAGNVQVCTAAMVYGFKIVQDMNDGLSNYMDEMGFTSVSEDRRQGPAHGHQLAVPEPEPYQQGRHQPGQLHPVRALPHCLRRHLAPGHHRMKDGKRHFEVKEDECVGCNLCTVVCPVPECITLRDLAPGEKDLRTGLVVSDKYANWTTHTNNPIRTADSA
jgi:dihydropyrimidine dehydrogenase (NAD+) subunit PreA